MRSLRVSDESIDNMNRGLAANINARVGPTDTLWCLGDWVFGQGSDYFRRARWFRDQIRCRTVFLIWGNHDDRKIRDLFTCHIRSDRDSRRRCAHHAQPLPDADLERPAPWLGGRAQHSSLRPRARLYQNKSENCPVKYADAWPALDVGFDGHDYQVWSLEEILARASTQTGGPRRVETERGPVRPVPRARPATAVRGLAFALRDRRPADQAYPRDGSKPASISESSRTPLGEPVT